MIKSSLTVAIPAYNEQENLEESIGNVRRGLEGLIDDYEIIIINDGSKDRTAQVAEALAQKDKRIRWYSNDRNRGYGFSWWRGVMLATKDNVTVYPADNDFAWESFRDMARHTGEADIITSYMTNPQARDLPRRALSRLFVIMMNLAFGMRLRYFNGPFICRRDLLQSLSIRSTGLTILAECKVRLIKRGCSYLEVPFAHIPRAHGRSTALSLKSIKAVTLAVSCLFWDIYFGKNEGKRLAYGNNRRI